MALFFIHFYLKAPPSLIWYLCDEEHPTYTQRSPEHLILIFPLRVELWLSVSLSREASCAESFKWRSRLVTLGDRDQLAGKEAVPLEDLPGDCGRLRRRSFREYLTQLKICARSMWSLLDYLGRYVHLVCEYKWSMWTYYFICTNIKVLYKYFKK